MIFSINKNIISCGLLCVVVFLQSCSDKELSGEDEIRQFIEKGVEAAENSSSSDLADLIREDYNDEKKLNKQQITKLLRAYFFRHKNIFLLTKIREIEFLTDEEAIVTLHVAMAGSVISDTSMLSSLRARIYKFEFKLVKEDEWLLRHAKWQRASFGDMK